MKAWPSGCCCALIVGWLLAGRAFGAEVVVEPIRATSQSFLYVDYSLKHPFEGKLLDAIRSGLPSTITYSVTVWRRRSGWWDDHESSDEVRLRVYRDLLNDQYVMATGEEVRRFPDLLGLTEAACEHQRQYLRPVRFPDKTHYVVVSATLAPLSVEDLRELEEWLHGTIRSGREASESGGVTGISGTMLGMLMSMTGFGDIKAETRGSNFTPARVKPILPGTPQAAGTPSRYDSIGQQTPPAHRPD